MWLLPVPVGPTPGGLRSAHQLEAGEVPDVALGIEDATTLNTSRIVVTKNAA